MMPGHQGRGWRRRIAYLTSPQALAILAGCALNLAMLLSIRLTAADPHGGDLCQDVLAIRHLLAHQNPYQPFSGCGVMHHLLHPPVYLLFIAPFVLPPIAIGALAWDVVNLLCLGAGVLVIMRERGARPSSWQLGLFFVLLSLWPPLQRALLEGQVSPLLFLLLVLAWRWARQGRSALAGGALGLAAALRLFPAFAVVYFFLRRDWHACFAAAAVFIGCSLLALPFVGVDGYLAYVTREAPANSAEWIHHPHNTSLGGLAHLLFTGSFELSPVVAAPALATPFAVLLIAALLCLLVWRTLLRRHRPFAADERTFLAYVPAMLLVSPMTWLYYHVILLLPMLLLCVDIGWLGAKSHSQPASGTKTPAPVRIQLARLLAGALALQWIYDLAERMSLYQRAPLLGQLMFALPTCSLLLLLLVDLVPWHDDTGPDGVVRERVPAGARVSGRTAMGRFDTSRRARLY